MKYNYAKSELREAVKILATGEKDVRKRLCSIAGIIKLNDNNFPTELRMEWKWILENLTKKEPEYLKNDKMLFSSIENTMRNMKNRSGSVIAEKIVNLYFKLQNS